MKKKEKVKASKNSFALLQKARKKVQEKLKNTEYEEDVESMKDFKLDKQMLKQTAGDFDLPEMITPLGRFRKGFIGKAIRIILNKYYWLLRNSLRRAFEEQDRFNKQTNRRLSDIERQDWLVDFNYAGFEEKFYANKDTDSVIKAKQRGYLNYFKPNDKVLDVGCGFGFFLELLEGKGIHAVGVDTDRISRDIARKKGLKVELGRVPGYLNKFSNESFDGITCLQVIEHLRNRDLTEFISLSSKKLKKGGYLVLETPNIENLGILSHTFYRDLTHLRPIHPDTLKFILETVGFDVEDTIYSSNIPEDQKLKHIQGQKEYNENIDKLNKLLYGPQDVAIVARKK
jgi:2-polyprenyl-3-methyl-5-hydroxy-6-metoxy-1,4-benzoquinol methylase